MDNIVPGEIRTQPVEGRPFWLLARKKKAMMLEAYNIAWLRVPSVDKFFGPRRCCKANPIGP